MSKFEMKVVKDKDGFRVISTDGTEVWDIDGPYETEEEAYESLDMHNEMWLQSHEDDE